MQSPTPLCYDCNYSHALNSRTCDAFPEGIPDEIWFGTVRHDQPYLGDHGIQVKLKFPNEFLCVTEVANLFSVNSKTIYRALRSERLPAYKIGKTWRIARGLHHDLRQALSGIESDLENAVRQIEGKEVKKCLESLRTLLPKVRYSIDELLRMGTHIFPPTLEDIGILATISWFCREFQKTYSGIQIEKQIDILENEVPSFLKIIIYKILREVLTNIATHSKADVVHLPIQKRNERVKLTIQDNGKGFDVGEVLKKQSHRETLGLSSLKERVKLSGGAFRIKSVLGKGTTIHASWQI